MIHYSKLYHNVYGSMGLPRPLEQMGPSPLAHSAHLEQMGPSPLARSAPLEKIALPRAQRALRKIGPSLARGVPLGGNGQLTCTLPSRLTRHALG